MIEEEKTYTRIKDAPWSSVKYHVTIGGVGGLGSWLAFFLARGRHTLAIYDDDEVGIENIGGGQFYSSSQAGMSKTVAIFDNINSFCGSTRIVSLPRFRKGSAVSNICFAVFDNMEARKDMFDSWNDLIKRRNNPESTYVFIDVSMLPEGGFIHVVDRPSRAKQWKKDWVPSDQIADVDCSFKSTTHNCALMAASAVSILNNITLNSIVKEELRYVPYKTIIDLTLMTFDMKMSLNGVKK